MRSPSSRFVFVACYYNMHASLARMLHSVAGQSYTNWRIIMTDDVSDASSRQDAWSIVSKFRDLVGLDRIVFNSNEEKKWETQNVLTMIRENCEDDDIVCRIDCDDYLTDMHALAVISTVYAESGCDALWTNHRWVDGDEISPMNISGPLEHDDPYVARWTTSHLKTFRKRLLNGVAEENFYNEDGAYARRAGDQYIYLPVLHRAQKRVHLPMVTYAYQCPFTNPQTFQTDDAKFQKAEAEFLRKRGFIE